MAVTKHNQHKAHFNLILSIVHKAEIININFQSLEELSIARAANNEELCIARAANNEELCIARAANNEELCIARVTDKVTGNIID